MVIWPEVADTAVKVGLGAFISAVATHRLTRLQLRSQLSRESALQIQQDNARILDLVTALRKALYRFNEAAGDYCVNRAEATLEPGMEQGLEGARVGLEQALLDLVEAHTRLSLRNEAAALALENFRVAADAYFREVWNQREQLGDEELSEAWSRLEPPLALLFQTLKTALSQHIEA